MNIVISNASGEPIYAQIVAQIKAAVMSGELVEGDVIPSMRVLAKELRISVITTKRAYEELERQGFIISMTGKGSFVAPRNLEILKEEQLRCIENYLQEAVNMAKTCNIGLQELSEMLMLCYGGEE